MAATTGTNKKKTRHFFLYCWRRSNHIQKMPACVCVLYVKYPLLNQRKQFLLLLFIFIYFFLEKRMELHTNHFIRIYIFQANPCVLWYNRYALMCMDVCSCKPFEVRVTTEYDRTYTEPYSAFARCVV